MLLIGNNLANYTVTLSVAVIMAMIGLSEKQAEIYTTAVVTPLLVVAGEMVPKSLFQARADTLVVRWMWLLEISRYLFTWTGLVGLIQGLVRGLMWLCRMHGRTAQLFAPRERIGAMLREQVAQGLLSRAQLDVARNVMAAGMVRVRDAMTPLARAVMIEASADRDTFVQVVTHNDFSRIPVTDDGAGFIVGFVDVNEVLMTLGQGRPIRDMVRPVCRLETTLSVTGALLAMQEFGGPLSVVVDRRGRQVGMVTIKDLASEIVGLMKH